MKSNKSKKEKRHRIKTPADESYDSGGNDEGEYIVILIFFITIQNKNIILRKSSYTSQLYGIS